MTSPGAALLLLFDVAPEATAEHDAWHTREHLPERLALPGFRRGSRWTALDGAPRYCVVYEVDDLAALDSPAYRARLAQPSTWTASMMRHYVGMRRTLCRAVAGFGPALGGAALVAGWRLPEDEAARHAALDRVAAALPEVAALPGVASGLLLARGALAAMTREQAIRGQDASVDAALIVTVYDDAALAPLAAALAPALPAGAAPARYRLACTLSAGAAAQR